MSSLRRASVERPGEGATYPYIVGYTAGNSLIIMRQQSYTATPKYTVQGDRPGRHVSFSLPYPSPEIYETTSYPVYQPNPEGDDEISPLTGVAHIDYCLDDQEHTSWLGGWSPVVLPDMCYAFDVETGGIPQIKRTDPDGSYTIYKYDPSNGGVLPTAPTSVEVFEADDTSLARLDLIYNTTTGRLTQAQVGNRVVAYSYDDTDNAIIVTEQSASPQVQTVYHYGASGGDGTTQPSQYQTWVIRKHTADGVVAVETGDQKTAFDFDFDSNGDKTDINKVTDPIGNATSFWYSGHHIVCDEDASGVRNFYTYGTDSQDVVTHILHYTNDYAFFCTEDLTYYTDTNGNDTGCLKTYRDVRGNYLHFVRNDIVDAPWKVDEIKVSPPNPGGGEPTWSSVAPLCTYEYFDSTQDVTSAGAPVNYLGQPLAVLYDGEVGPGHEDTGSVDCTSTLELPTIYYSNAYSHADTCSWDWGATEHKLASVSLYIHPSQTATAPKAVTIQAKDPDGEYSILLHSTEAGETESWQAETYNSQSVLALHFNVSLTTKSLRITYGRDDVDTPLGEVRIVAQSPGTSDGKSKQIKKITVPNVDGSEPFWVQFAYGEDGKIRTSPTSVTYRYHDGQENSVYQTKTCTAQYDEAQRLVLGTDANSRTVQFAYDALGRLKTATYAPAVFSQNDFTCCGLLSSSDPDGRTGYFGHDDASRVINAYTEVSGQGSSSPPIEGLYDAFGRMDTIKTYVASGSSARTSTATFDQNNRITGVTYPDGLIGSEEVAYDPVGNPLWTKDSNGKYTLYHYDNLNRLNAVLYSDLASPPVSPYDGSDPSLSIVYEPQDDLGTEGFTNLVTEVTEFTEVNGERIGSTSYFSYDFLGRLATYTPAGQSQITYTYNNLGQVASVTTGSYSVQYDYYANGWLRAVEADGVTLASYAYNPAGVLTNVTYGNGVQAAVGHSGADPRYPISSISYTKSSSTLASFGYTARDNALNPTAISDSIFGDSAFGPYDAAGQLSSASYTNPLPDQPAGGSYAYDWVGNRTSPPAGTNAMQYNAVDQLTLWPGMYAYSYDGAGNLQTVRARDASGPVVASYTYYRNGLLETATHGDTALANTWDTLGNRVQVSVTKGGLTETHNFVYNPLAGVPAVIVESKSGGKAYYYYRDPSGVLIARRDAADTTGDTWQYYHYDELGSTRLITNKDGVVTDRYAYDAYGGTIAHNGSTTDNPYQYVGALGYYTHHQDPEFRLLQLGFRFYDPETGRFTQQDPIGAGINWYAYCGGNPMGSVDPWGLLDPCAGISYDYLLDQYVWQPILALPGYVWDGIVGLVGRAEEAILPEYAVGNAGFGPFSFALEYGDGWYISPGPSTFSLDPTQWRFGAGLRVGWFNDTDYHYPQELDSFLTGSSYSVIYGASGFQVGETSVGNIPLVGPTATEIGFGTPGLSGGYGYGSGPLGRKRPGPRWKAE